jgi:hypothetical protein
MVVRRASLVLVTVMVLACSCAASPSAETADAGCPSTLAAYCSQNGCAQSWSTAVSLACLPTCGQVYLYACNGFDVAQCPGDEGGGVTSFFDPATGALVAVAHYPSIIGPSLPGCFVGRESLRSLYDSGSAPSCPTGPLLGCDGRPVGIGSETPMDGSSLDAGADGP